MHLEPPGPAGCVAGTFPRAPFDAVRLSETAAFAPKAALEACVPQACVRKPGLRPGARPRKNPRTSV